MTRRALRLPGSRRQWRRALRFALTWLAVVLGLAGLGLQPAVPLLAAVAVAAYTLVVTVEEPVREEISSWVSGDLSGVSLTRGSDHRTTALAEQLARVPANPDTMVELSRRVHQRLCAVLDARVWRAQHIDLPRNMEWARQILPPELADLYLLDPTPDLLRAETLDRHLTRIEQL